MTIVLDTPRVFGGVVVTALVRTTIAEYRFADHIAVTANRTPLFILVRTGDRIDAFTPHGDRVALSQLQTLSPDPVAQFLHLDIARVDGSPRNPA